MTNLEYMRRKRKLSPAALAVKADVSERLILNYEKCIGNPKPNTLKAVSGVLRVRPSALFVDGWFVSAPEVPKGGAK